ncbi:unnamed protein product, partial [marine sediment metagenome]
MNRRDMLFSMATGLAAFTLPEVARAYGGGTKKARLGIADFSCNIRLRAERTGRMKGKLSDPLNFLDHCHNVGAGGVQMNIGIRDKVYTRKLRENAVTYDMFIEGSASLPRDQSDVERFEAAVRTVKQAGANVIRIAIGGRRYEQFARAEQFKAFAKRTWKSLQLAEPVAARHRMRLAIENHKDWR